MSSRFEERLGNCYGLSGDYLMSHPASVLVHGSIQGMNHPRIDHAWVSGGDHVWEPITDSIYPTSIFTKTFNAKERRTYTWDEAVRKMADTGHYGPWDEVGRENEQ